MARGSPVYACLLDASKAFDLVDHSVLFKTLLARDAPPLLVRFLLSWYSSQSYKVLWDGKSSHPFSVSNGVRQGGVLSPVLFTIYLDSLLDGLEGLGVGCHLDSCFVGALCYADDLILLAPCPSALRIMLRYCETFASSHGIRFNPAKTQLIRFSRRPSSCCLDRIYFCNQFLPFSDTVIHLGHLLSYDLSDKADIVSKTRDFLRKANLVLHNFSCCDPLSQTYLLRSFCLSLYGCALWRLDSSEISIMETAFNKVLRRIWKLPPASHTRIVHCTAGLFSIYNLIYSRSSSLLSAALSSSSIPVSLVFGQSSNFCYTFSGYNHLYGSCHMKTYYPENYVCASVIRSYRCSLLWNPDLEHIVSVISCS